MLRSLRGEGQDPLVELMVGDMATLDCRVESTLT